MLEAFFAALAQNPNDWLTRAALADWFEENGLEHTAACVRWMVRTRRRPSINALGWAFWFNADRPMLYTEKAAHLPEALFRALHGAPGTYTWYDDLRDAEEALHAAWAAALDAGTWQPD
jgi:uncharacterized protein (TIGR02996 family)